VKLLITIKGITPLTALAFLADVGDVRRFKSLRKMNAYLGLVPRVKASGGKSMSGHINCEADGQARLRASSHRPDPKSLQHHETDAPDRRRVPLD